MVSKGVENLGEISNTFVEGVGVLLAEGQPMTKDLIMV